MHEARSLVCRSTTRLCALPLLSVVETMRPLPIEPIGSAPPFVLGLSVIRGEPVAVIDLGLLLGGDAGSARAPCTRFVTLRTASRRVALAVEEVLGVRAVAAGSMGALPPLLSQSASSVVDAIGTLDRELMVVLNGARLLPDEP